MTIEPWLLGTIVVLIFYSGFLVRQLTLSFRRFEDLAGKYGALVEQRHRAYWTSSNTWIDPDCFECGGEGAPCCDPPTYPYRRGREGVPFGGDGWTSENPRRPVGHKVWEALDAMQTGSFPVVKPEPGDRSL